MKILAYTILLSLLTSSCARPPEDDPYASQRKKMVQEQIKARGIQSERVLRVLEKVQRHLFVPERFRRQAYDDNPQEIGYGQTISQPYIVAFMTEILQLEPHERVLEIGTGSGYQAAVLAELAREVYSIEIITELASQAEQRLKEIGYRNIHVRCGDGYAGWPEAAPFDAIIVTAAPSEIPAKLVEQLKTGGRMIIPVGTVNQELILIRKNQGGLTQERVLPVRFVPMVKEKE